MCFVYLTYIATTPEKLWQALMDIDLMAQWWVDPKAGCVRVNVSDWKPGSSWEHRRADGSGIVDIAPYSEGLVKLTVAHVDLAKDPAMLSGVSGGWPTVLSNLKTFLETGRALPKTAMPAHA
jgi:hypothetical protein